MRKSSAPSLKTLSSVAKKRKFSTPFTNNSPTTATSDQDASTKSSAGAAIDNQNTNKIVPEFSSRPLKNNKFGVVYNANSKNNISGVRKSSNPSKTFPLTSNNNTASKSFNEDDSKDVTEKYFEVVW